MCAVAVARGGNRRCRCRHLVTGSLLHLFVGGAIAGSTRALVFGAWWWFLRKKTERGHRNDLQHDSYNAYKEEADPTDPGLCFGSHRLGVRTAIQAVRAHQVMHGGTETPKRQTARGKLAHTYKLYAAKGSPQIETGGCYLLRSFRVVEVLACIAHFFGLIFPSFGLVQVHVERTWHIHPARASAAGKLEALDPFRCFRQRNTSQGRRSCGCPSPPDVPPLDLALASSTCLALYVRTRNISIFFRKQHTKFNNNLSYRRILALTIAVNISESRKPKPNPPPYSPPAQKHSTASRLWLKKVNQGSSDAHWLS